MNQLGFKPVFSKAGALSKVVDYSEYFPNFHDHPELFHFIMAHEEILDTDNEALALASSLDRPTYTNLLLLGPSLVGNGSPSLDAVESRHILFITYLVSKLGKDWGKVVEIGGGYGNCLRLATNVVNYTKWTIIDLDFICDLQRWFINTTCPDIKNVEFLNAGTRLEEPVELVIGAHSLSEFSLEDFVDYYNSFIKNSTRLFYVTHNQMPSVDLLRTKIKIIQEDFYLENLMTYENGNSTMFLFKNRSE